MAFSDMQTAIADELARSDNGFTAASPTFINREITNAITFYQNEHLWFNENVLSTITTISGQRLYTIPTNFASILNVRSQMSTGGLIYTIEATTIQYLDEIDLVQNFSSNYITYYALFNGQIRLYPPPIAGLPIYIRGTVILPTLTTTAATKSYAVNTAYSVNDTILDTNANIQICITAGTTQAAASKTYTANTAYSVGDTVIDGNDNLQKCTTAGTSGYLVAANINLWATSVNGITQDGTVQWTMQSGSIQWNTNYNGLTLDGTVVWKLTNNTGNAWTSNAEELIRTRAIQQLYGRYIHDDDRFQIYTGLVKDSLMNLRRKNIGQITSGRITSHI